jgi:hypothetical protein
MLRILRASLVVIVGALFVSCLNPLAPVPQDPCPGSLTCRSPSVPNGVTCCVNPYNSSVGYLCAYGANYQPAGCMNQDQASQTCGVYNMPYTVVRCVAGG